MSSNFKQIDYIPAAPHNLLNKEKADRLTIGLKQVSLRDA